MAERSSAEWLRGGGASPDGDARSRTGGGPPSAEAEECKKRATEKIKSGASKVKGIRIWLFGVDFQQAAEKDWAEAADSLLRGLMEEAEPVLIMIDEFSVFVNALSELVQDTRGDQKTRFASNLLRDYWARKHA